MSKLTMGTAATATAAALLLTGASGASGDPKRPESRVLHWTCEDGTTFSAVRPSVPAAASPVVGSTSVWIQLTTEINGEVTKTRGNELTGAFGGRVLTCETTVLAGDGSVRHVRVTGLLT